MNIASHVKDGKNKTQNAKERRTHCIFDKYYRWTMINCDR